MEAGALLVVVVFTGVGFWIRPVNLYRVCSEMPQLKMPRLILWGSEERIVLSAQGIKSRPRNGARPAFRLGLCETLDADDFAKLLDRSGTLLEACFFFRG